MKVYTDTVHSCLSLCFIQRPLPFSAHLIFLVLPLFFHVLFLVSSAQ